jgi:hypothetical protein
MDKMHCHKGHKALETQVLPNHQSLEEATQSPNFFCDTPKVLNQKVILNFGDIQELCWEPG